MEIDVVYPMCPTCKQPLIYVIRTDTKEPHGTCPRCSGLFKINPKTVDEVLVDLRKHADKGMFYMARLLVPVEE